MNEPSHRNPGTARALALGALVALALPACAVHQVERDRPPPLAVPDDYVYDERTPSPAPLPERWWYDLDAPQLATLVDEALQGNFDLRRAWARLDQARAAARIAGAPRSPQVDASFGANASRQVFPVGGNTFETVGISTPLSLSASYELDLWGRIRSLESAADLETRATREDLEAAAMTIAAQVAETWAGAAEQSLQRAILEQQLQLNETYLELVRLRFGQGQATALDVLQQRQQVTATRAQLPLVDARLAVLQNQLSILTGRPPGAVVVQDATLPALPPPPPTGVPLDLLRRRPDVRAAHARILAADHRVGAAIADRYPALRLSASTGFQGRDTLNIFTNWVWNLGANLVAPLLDGGRRAAEVDRQRAVLDELLQVYGQTLLRSLKEVEDALVQEQQQRQYLAELDVQIEQARTTLEEARARYTTGLVDYLTVLTSLRSLQQAEVTRLTAQRQLVAYRIQLYRALGGSWTDDLRRPDTTASAPRASGEPR